MSWHPAEELSAYLDGELAPGEAAVVETHLGDCDACRQELTELAGARLALRRMDALAAPPGMAERFVGRLRNLLRLAAAGAGAAGAAAAAVLVVAAPPAPVSSPARLMASLRPAPPAGSAISPGQIPSAYATPAELDALPLVSLERVRQMVSAVYGDGGRRLVVFEEDGQLRLDPRDHAEPTAMGGHDGYLYRVTGRQAFTWQAGRVVLTLVGSPQDLPEAARSLGMVPRREGLVSRARELCRDLVEALSGT